MVGKWNREREQKIREQQPDPPYGCKICGFKTNLISHTTAHFRKFHNIQRRDRMLVHLVQVTDKEVLDYKDEQKEKKNAVQRERLRRYREILFVE